MTHMIERVAQRMGAAMHSNRLSDETLRVLAREAIEATREPTAPMIDSGVAFALCVTLGGDYRWSEYVADLHRAMTDAALTPTGDAQ